MDHYQPRPSCTSSTVVSFISRYPYSITRFIKFLLLLESFCVVFKVLLLGNRTIMKLLAFLICVFSAIPNGLSRRVKPANTITIYDWFNWKTYGKPRAVLSCEVRVVQRERQINVVGTRPYAPYSLQLDIVNSDMETVVLLFLSERKGHPRN